MAKTPAFSTYVVQGISWGNVLLASTFVVGVPFNFYMATLGESSFWVHFLVGVLLYNCGFTIWHEAAHDNISSHKWLNDFFGVASSIVNLVPPFYRQKHDHLLHHMHLLDVEKDRTVYRARRPFWLVPISILHEMGTYGPYKEKYGLKTKWKKNLDMISFLAVLMLAGLCIWTGFGFEFLICCFAPRVVILPIHVTYVCYLPHVGLPKNRRQGTRVLEVGPLKYLIFFHNYHAVHHLWPSIPWYLYPKYYRLNRATMEAYGVQDSVKPWEAPIFNNESLKTGTYDRLNT